MSINIPQDKSSTVSLTDRHGITRYLNEFGQLHREGDLPAVDSYDKSEYYKNGMLHRDEGPALKTSTQEAYYKHGVLHRDGDMPAVVHFITDEKDNRKLLCQEFYKEGVLHREKGPAIMWANGSYQHYQNGLMHNASGVACHSVETGQSEYWLEGKEMSKVSHKMSLLRNNIISDNHKKNRP